MVFNSIVALPTVTYPPSLNLSTSSNGVTAVSLGSNIKAVLFNKEETVLGSNLLSFNIDNIVSFINVADSYNGKEIALELTNGDSFSFTLNTSQLRQTLSTYNSFNSINSEKLRRWNLGYGGDGLAAENIEKSPVVLLIPTSNITYNLYNDLTEPSYLVVKTTVTTFSAYFDNNLLGFINNADLNNFSNNNIELVLSEGLSANKLTIPVTQSATLSTNQGNFYTLYYSNTGSAILGLAKQGVSIPNLTTVPDLSSDDTRYINQPNQTITMDNEDSIYVVSYTNQISSFKAIINSTEVEFKVQNVGVFEGLGSFGQNITVSYEGNTYPIITNSSQLNFLSINGEEYGVNFGIYKIPSKGWSFLISKIPARYYEDERQQNISPRYSEDGCNSHWKLTQEYIPATGKTYIRVHFEGCGGSCPEDCPEQSCQQNGPALGAPDPDGIFHPARPNFGCCGCK
jgi:hypothetical protein